MEAGESRLEATGLEGPRRRADQLEPETPPLDGSALEVLLAHSPVPAWVHVDDRIVYVNAAAVRVLGAGGAGQIVGLSPANLLLNASDGHPGLAREQVIRRLDGSSFAAEVTAWPLAGAAASAIVVTFHDLSEGLRDLATARDGSRLGESGLEGVAIHDGAALIDANGSLARMFSYELEDLIGRPLMDLVAPESQRPARAEEHDEQAYRIAAIRRDGSRFPAECRGRNIEYRGRAAQVLMVRDLTEQKRSEQAFDESGERYRQIVETAAEGIWILDDSGGTVFANRRVGELLGYSTDELAGRLLFDFIYPEDREVALQRFEARKRGNRSPGEIRMARRDGSPVWMNVTGSALRGPGGAVTGVLVMLTDVSARKKTEEALRESEATFRAVFDLAAVGIAQLTIPEGRYIAVNQRLADITGYSREEMLRVSFQDLTHPDDVARESALLAKLAAGEMASNRFEKRYVRKDGSVIWVDTHLSLVRALSGEPQYAIAVIEDITERRRAEDALRESTEIIRALLESASQAILAVHTDGRIASANAMAERIFGYSREELVGQSIDLLVPAEYRERHAAHRARYHASPRPRPMGAGFDLSGRRKDGSEFPVEISLSYVPTKTGVLAVSFVTDITERKAAERALRESESRFRQMADVVPAFVWTSDAGGAMTYFNRRWYEYTGMSVAHSLRMGWIEAVHPDDREVCLSAWRDAGLRETRLEVELRYRGRAGQYRWFLVRAEPLRDAQGVVSMWFGTNTDIEDRRRTEDALRRANEDLNQFAYSASHDLQEPLRMVIAYTQLLAKRSGDILDDESRECIGYAIDGARRMEMLVHDLLTYTHAANPTAEDAVPVDCNAVMRVVVSNLQLAIEQNQATVAWGPLPTVPAHHVYLLQLFQNLVANALKYRSEAPPRIEISAERHAHEWLFSVRDNGIGIDPGYAKQVFGIFKRLHGPDKYAGTGIGLAICQRIVERYGGRIWVESEPGHGAVFYFTLPA